MRPRELTLRGFRSYAEESTFSWHDRGLVGVVGPTGSGKSSILDAISFALYGKTPRIERDTKSLINQRRDALHVALTFDIDGDRYKVVRSLRRGGASAHTLYQIEDGVDVELTDKSREVTERLEMLLGLDFDAFRRSVLLAQNQFSRFLEATGTERNQVLKGVFDFERLDGMRSVAKDRLEALGGRLAVLADRRATADADRTELAAKGLDLEAAETRAAALEELRGPFEEVKVRIDAAELRCEAAQHRLETLNGLSDRIPKADDAGELFGAAGSADANVTAAQGALVVASDAKEAAAAGLTEALASVGGRDGLASAGDLVAAWKASSEREAEARRVASELAQKVAEARELASGIAARASASTEAAEAAGRDEAATAAALADVRTLVQAARQAHRAHAVRSELVAGEPCPVCEQTVAVVPAGGRPPSLEDAETAASTAQEALATAAAASRIAAEGSARLGAEAAAAEQAVVGAASAAEEAADRRDTSQRDLEDAAAAAAESLGEGDPQVALASIRANSVAADAALEEATATEQRARSAVDDAVAAATGTAAALRSLRTELATLAGTLGADIEVGESSEALDRALSLLRTHWEQQQAAATAEVAEACAEAPAARAALRDLLDAAGLGDKDDVVEVIAAALAERTAKEAEVHLIERRLADLEQLLGDEADLMASSDLLRTIHGDLAPSKFLEFVLDERRRALGALASEHLEVLTGGRYRFDDSGDFLVVDLTAADAIRSPASLSGGETFLASLALALSLAEIVAREGGRLDAFFLDEGFGSLDPEHLDLAMDGIERLVTAGTQRLVVVVSHVPALRERMEDLVILDRDPITGDSIIVAGASPP